VYALAGINLQWRKIFLVLKRAGVLLHPSKGSGKHRKCLHRVRSIVLGAKVFFASFDFAHTESTFYGM